VSIGFCFVLVFLLFFADGVSVSAYPRGCLHVSV